MATFAHNQCLNATSSPPVSRSALLPRLLAAQVDDRLNGDGVGYPLGVSDPALGWTIGIVATLIWVAYFISQRDFGDFEDKDSGLGL